MSLTQLQIVHVKASCISEDPCINHCYNLQAQLFLEDFENLDDYEFPNKLVEFQQDYLKIDLEILTENKKEKEPLRNQFGENSRTAFDKEDLEDKTAFAVNDRTTEDIELTNTNLSNRGTILVCPSPLATRRKGGPISNMVHTILCVETIYDMK